MTESRCQSCTAPATLFLCERCIEECRSKLRSLAHGPVVGGHQTAGLLDALADAALGRTRLSDKSTHRQRSDESPALYVPDIEKLDRAGNVVLSPQGRAAWLLNDARNKLSAQIRDICESRGIDIMRAFRVVPASLAGPLPPDWRRAEMNWTPTTAEMAAWLAEHVHAIACDESAGQYWAEIDALVRQIERAIDRPVAIELLGFCITQVHNGTCDTALRAPEDAIEVRCRKCRTVRRCDTVRAQGQGDARRKLITWEEVLETNKCLPEGWRVNDRTLRDWRATGVLKVHQYRRPDGGFGLHRRSDADVPLYKWGDIEQLRSRRVPRGERKRTRAGR